jgi:hypothetical protein
MSVGDPQEVVRLLDVERSHFTVLNVTNSKLSVAGVTFLSEHARVSGTWAACSTCSSGLQSDAYYTASVPHSTAKVSIREA